LKRSVIVISGNHGTEYKACGYFPSTCSLDSFFTLTTEIRINLVCGNQRIARTALAEGGSEKAAVHGGFIEVSDDHVKILSDLAEMASTIDVERARRAQEKAQAAAQNGDDDEAMAALARASARLVTVEGFH